MNTEDDTQAQELVPRRDRRRFFWPIMVLSANLLLWVLLNSGPIWRALYPVLLGEALDSGHVVVTVHNNTSRALTIEVETVTGRTTKQEQQLLPRTCTTFSLAVDEDPRFSVSLVKAYPFGDRDELLFLAIVPWPWATGDPPWKWRDPQSPYGWPENVVAIEEGDLISFDWFDGRGARDELADMLEAASRRLSRDDAG